MSYDTGMLVWVSDLDEYIDVDGILGEDEVEAKQEALEVEQEALEAELTSLGDIPLFSGKSISSRTIFSHGVNPERWRWMKHRAELAFSQSLTSNEIEAAFLKATMSLGLRYAVARFARLEGLPYSSATTATFPHGIRALLYQFMAREKTLSSISCRTKIQETLHHAGSSWNLIAYERTGLVRKGLHELSIKSGGANSEKRLDKEEMRRLLALFRLHFLVRECQVRSISQLKEINSQYERARIAVELNQGEDSTITGRKIMNWKMRFLHPLTFYFPYTARHSLNRILFHSKELGTPLQSSTAINELALINCGLDLMKRTAKMKVKSDE